MMAEATNKTKQSSMLQKLTRKSMYGLLHKHYLTLNKNRNINQDVLIRCELKRKNVLFE